MKNKIVILSLLSLLNVTTAHADAWSDALVYFNKANGFPTPTKANTQGFFNWGQCWDDKDDSQPIGPADVAGLPEACQPDTLYSWGGPQKLKEMQDQAGATTPWTNYFEKEIFTHINPAATFGYGPIAFRFKIKPGAKYVLYTDDALPTDDNSLCKAYKVADQENMVLVRVWVHDNLDGVDYILCSPKVIESWSYDTKTHYDEVVASLRWNNAEANSANNSLNWIPYTYQDHQPQLFNSGLDGKDWSPATMLHRLQDMKTRAQSNSNAIVYQDGVPHDSYRHFATKRPIYWNWNHPATGPAVAPAAPVKAAPAAAPTTNKP